MRPMLMIFLSPAVTVFVSSVLAAASSSLKLLRRDIVPLLVTAAASSLWKHLRRDIVPLPVLAAAYSMLTLLRRDIAPLLLRSPSSRTPAIRRGCVVDNSLLADASRLTGVGL